MSANPTMILYSDGIFFPMNSTYLSVKICVNISVSKIISSDRIKELQKITFHRIQ